MGSPQSLHIDNVFSIAAGARRPGAPASLVHQSWARCVREHGLDPSRPRSAHILPAHQVREHQQPIEQFLLAARAGMEDLYRRVADLGYMVLLTDAQGITVDYIGNPALDDQLRRAGLYLGADWNEAHAGTCGVGTCLVEQMPLTCHQTEHFDATHIALTCTTAPLFDHSGRLIAVLDVSALSSPQPRESQHLARELVSMVAQMIEDADFLRHFRSHWILRLGRAYGLVDVAGDVMLAFDDDGVVTGANTGARRKFARVSASTAGLVGRSVADVVDMPFDAIWRLAHGGAAARGTAATTLLQGTLHHASLLAPRGRPIALRRVAPALPESVHEARAPNPAATLERLAGDDASMQRLLAQARRLLDHRIHVLIQGETGSGKEVLARAMHAASARSAAPFVAVNCASIPESLIESELFGYTPGSFTGGRSKGMKGLIAQADGGTLFLDEIGDMPLMLQTRLLRVLAEGEVMPLGGSSPQRVDLAVITATHRDLRDRVAAGAFREDLYYRLRGAALTLPPLRERGDKRHLIESVFREEARALNPRARLSSAALDLLLAHRWPGNLRELRNVLRLALALCEGTQVGPENLPAELLQGAGPALPRPPNDDIAPASLLEALKRHQWRVAPAARELGICRATVYRHMKRQGLVPPNHQ